MILAHDRVTAPGAVPDRWLLVLHGIYGAGRNWGSVARRFVRARPEWGALLVDLRLHGDSGGLGPPHTIPSCVEDLVRLVEHERLPVDAVLGHSFGGKVALLYLAEAAAGGRVSVPAVTWVVESTPAVRSPEGSAWKMLGVLRAHPGPFADRAAGIAAVESSGFPNPVAQWMATNLVPRGGAKAPGGGSNDGLVWRLDPDDMEALLRDFFATDAWPVLERPPEGARIHVVKAVESSVLNEGASERIEEIASRTRDAVSLHTVSGGHWVNADDPDGLHRLLMEYMP